MGKVVLAHGVGGRLHRGQRDQPGPLFDWMSSGTSRWTRRGN